MAVQVLVLLVTAAATVCTAADMEDPTVAFVRLALQTFLRTTETGPNHNFTCGLDSTNKETGVTNGIFASRFGGPDKGTFYTLMPEGDRTTLDFTVENSGGFQATIRRDVPKRPVVHDYGRLAAPLAYNSRPAPESTAMTRIGGWEDARKIGPLPEKALKILIVTINYFHLKPPYNATMGYQLWNGDNGQVLSQYLSVQGSQGKGRVVLVDPDGTQMSMTIVLQDNDYYITTPVAHKP